MKAPKKKGHCPPHGQTRFTGIAQATRNAASEAEPWSGQGGPLWPFGPLDEQGLGPGIGPGQRPCSAVTHGEVFAGQQGQGARVTATAVWMRRLGVAGMVVGISLLQRPWRAIVHLRAGTVRAGITHGRTGPLQGQAKQH